MFTEVRPTKICRYFCGICHFCNQPVNLGSGLCPGGRSGDSPPSGSIAARYVIPNLGFKVFTTQRHRSRYQTSFSAN
jgi:hypothetical protein